MLERVCIILVVNLIFFYRTLKLKYCSDDIPTLQHPPASRHIWHFRYQQLVALRRVTEKQDHAITMVLHAMTAAFVYLALGANDISFLAAILFSFNPANNQCSVWISGRGYVLITLCLLIAMTFKYVSPLFLYFASSYPLGFFSPIGLIGSPKWYILIAMPIIWAIRFKRLKESVKVKRAAETVIEDRKMNINKVVMAIKTYAFYFILCLVPWRLCFYHEFLQSAAGNEIMRKRAYRKDGYLCIGLAIIGYLVYSIWHWTPISWGVFWFSVCIAPYTNLIRMQQEIAERYLYLASIGLMFSLANIIIAYPMAIAVILTVYIVRLFYYLPAFTDDYNICEYAVLESPNSWYAWHTRALKRFSQHSYREALNMWVMAKLLSPKEFKVIMNIAVMLLMMKKNEEAEKFLKLAEENIIPGQEEMAHNIIKDARSGKIPICT